jgi:hypothetical protein
LDGRATARPALEDAQAVADHAGAGNVAAQLALSDAHRLVATEVAASSIPFLVIMIAKPTPFQIVPPTVRNSAWLRCWYAGRPHRLAEKLLFLPPARNWIWPKPPLLYFREAVT